MVSQGSELESCKIRPIETRLVGFLAISVLETMDRTYVMVLLEGSGSECRQPVFVVRVSKKKKYLSLLYSSTSFYVSLQEERVVMVLEYEQEFQL